MRWSVIVPAHNRGPALRATLDSALAQTERDLELLVVSDASTDDTDQVVRAVPDARVRLLRCEQRAGHPGPPRNLGLREARGELVAYLDHDDRWRPDHLERLGALLGAGAPIAAAGATRVDATGAEVGRSTGLDAIWHPEIQTMAAMFEPSRVAHRHALVLDAGGWTGERAGLEDWELWLRLTDLGIRFATHAERTVWLHTATTTRTHELPLRFALTIARVPSADHARSALAFLRVPEVREHLRRLHVRCAQDWYASLEDLVLPESVARNDVPALVEAAVPDDTTEALAVRAHDEGVAVVRPLACTSREHAKRIEATLRTRFAAKLRWLARALAAAPAPPARPPAPAARAPAREEPRRRPARGPSGPSNGRPDIATWRCPTTLAFGPGAITSLGPTAAQIGSRVLVVTDPRLAEGPAVAAGVAALRDAGVEAVLAPVAESHPGLDAVAAAAARARSADVVVGLGGGSSMDVAKAAALAARHPTLLHDPGWHRTGGLIAPSDNARGVPLVQVPTTPATGAEVTALASLSDSAGRKRLLLHVGLQAGAAIVDPALHVTLPQEQTAAAASETLLRVVVPFLNDRPRPIADGVARAMVQAIMDAAPRALLEPKDLEARGTLALAATRSNLGLDGLGRDPFGNVLFYLEHALGTISGAAKGVGMAALARAYLDLVCRRGDELPRLGRPHRLAALFGVEDPRAAMNGLLEALASWGLPTALQDVDAVRLADATLELWGERAILGWLGRAELEELYRASAQPTSEVTA